ncbi:hypothetical protein [Ochrovirga pacifica]|uniref:hypothetical protein n=1 Tax=Ochrovirga pacifica TaxID=1042376 RepID=UPI0002557F96|nr:hypothetical protein [Ochrovirga pacifica]
MIKKLFLRLVFLYSCLSSAQSDLSIFTKKNRVRLNYMVLKMPYDFNAKDKKMALGGLHYQIPITNKFYLGTNTHAALFGDQGGLFTLGIEIGLRQPIFKNLSLDTNLDFGGGGGYRSLINKGAYINPNIGLAYQFKNITFGAQYSHFNFYTGSIKDNSVSLFLEFSTKIQTALYSEKNNSYDLNNVNKLNNKKSAFAIKLDQYFPFGRTRKDFEHNSELLRNTLYLLGFEYQKYINQNTFVFIHSDAVYSGLVAGFMDIFGGIGYEPIQTNHFNIFTKLAIGSAGGRVRAEGGATMYPSLGIDYHISSKTSLFAHVGYTRALDGYFEAYTMGGGIKFSTQPQKVQELTPTKIYTKGVRVSMQHQTYLDIKRQVREPLDQLHLLALQFNYDLNKSLYLIAQTAFAYESRYNGSNFESAKWGAGGYADGMIGMGVYSPIFAKGKIQPFAEVLIGAGGGAGIDAGGGIISKVKVGSYYKLTSHLSLIVSGGKVISPFANVNSNNINIGFSVNFSTLTTLFK